MNEMLALILKKTLTTKDLVVSRGSDMNERVLRNVL